MFKILHLADIHMGSGFSHGQVNSETGINSRLEDFDQTLGLCMDRAIAEPVDLVIFAGDAFPDATPPPMSKKPLPPNSVALPMQISLQSCSSATMTNIPKVVVAQVSAFIVPLPFPVLSWGKN